MSLIIESDASLFFYFLHCLNLSYMLFKRCNIIDVYRELCHKNNAMQVRNQTLERFQLLNTFGSKIFILSSKSEANSTAIMYWPFTKVSFQRSTVMSGKAFHSKPSESSSVANNLRTVFADTAISPKNQRMLTVSQIQCKKWQHLKQALLGWLSLKSLRIATTFSYFAYI